MASYSPLDAAQSDIEKSFSLHPSVQTALLAAQILIYKNEFIQALKMYQIGSYNTNFSKRCSFILAFEMEPENFDILLCVAGVLMRLERWSGPFS